MGKCSGYTRGSCPLMGGSIPSPTKKELPLSLMVKYPTHDGRDVSSNLAGAKGVAKFGKALDFDSNMRRFKSYHLLEKIKK